MKILRTQEEGRKITYFQMGETVYRSDVTPTELLRAYPDITPDLHGEKTKETLDAVLERSRSGRTMTTPYDPQEVWGSGISYYVSRKRYSESDVARIGDRTIYELIYDSERPEIFFKATATRCVGEGGNIRVRKDSIWTLSEPELGVVIRSDGRILAYTIVDDVSARDIESENPLYLPESKIYSGCCAFGPVMVTADEIRDPYSLDIAMTIFRNGNAIFSGKTSTSNMKTRIDKQIRYLLLENPVPDFALLTTGTSVVPGREEALRNGDSVSITIDGIGTLTTGVVKDD